MCLQGDKTENLHMVGPIKVQHATQEANANSVKLS